MSIIKDLGNEIKNAASRIWSNITDSVGEDTAYQSPLELNGRAMRAVSRQMNYYSKYYPYVSSSDNALLRTNNAYVSTSGWKPATVSVDKTNILQEEEAALKDLSED